MIKGKNVSLCYQRLQQVILNDVSFELPIGRITTFIGPSGAGKTSLLRCIAQLECNYTGLICDDDSDMRAISARERIVHIGFVAQQFNLFPHLSVLENCAQPLYVTGAMERMQAERRACDILNTLGISALCKKYPQQLSGGQQQRVAIARALCFNPTTLLFDEPTSALDPENTAVIAMLLLQLARQGVAIGVTSHDMSFVNHILDRVYFMREGSICSLYDAAEGATLSDSLQLFFSGIKESL